MAKATIKEMDSLHDAIAKQLKGNLDDPKMLVAAIRFLKDNNITVDLQESKEVQNLFTTINSLKVKPEDKNKDRVELLLQDYVG